MALAARPLATASAEARRRTLLPLQARERRREHSGVAKARACSTRARRAPVEHVRRARDLENNLADGGVRHRRLECRDSVHRDRCAAQLMRSRRRWRCVWRLRRRRGRRWRARWKVARSAIGAVVAERAHIGLASGSAVVARSISNEILRVEVAARVAADGEVVRVICSFGGLNRAAERDQDERVSHCELRRAPVGPPIRRKQVATDTFKSGRRIGHVKKRRRT